MEILIYRQQRKLPLPERIFQRAKAAAEQFYLVRLESYAEPAEKENRLVPKPTGFVQTAEPSLRHSNDERETMDEINGNRPYPRMPSDAKTKLLSKGVPVSSMCKMYWRHCIRLDCSNRVF